MTEHLIAKAESVGRIRAYESMLAAIQTLAHTEVAKLMPHGIGYAQALEDMIGEMRSLVAAEESHG